MRLLGVSLTAVFTCLSCASDYPMHTAVEAVPHTKPAPATRRVKFPPWRLPKSAGVKATLPCPAGNPTELRIEANGKAPRVIAIKHLTAEPGAFMLRRPRRRVVPARALIGRTAAVQFVPCRGKPVILEAAQLAQPARYVLVANRKGQLKLVDRGTARDQFRRITKGVVVMRTMRGAAASRQP